MNRVREASTMSVPAMRQMLGLKKTASYWLIKKQWFDVLTIHGEMRVVISSFETWYANQTHYRKVNGPPPGEELRKKSYSVKDISNLLGIGIDTVYDLIHREKIPYSVYQYGQWRVDAAVFQFWYNSQCTYHLVTAEHPNELHKANLMKLTEFGRLLGLERDETYKLVRQLKYVLEIVSISRQLYVTMSSYQRWRETETRRLLRLLQNVRERNCRKYCRLSAASSRRTPPFQHKISSLCRKQRHFCICRKEPFTGCVLTGGFRRNGWLRSGALRGLTSKHCLIRITAISKEEK